eukprot:1357308-Prymnesium_polylepis.1
MPQNLLNYRCMGQSTLSRHNEPRAHTHTLLACRGRALLKQERCVEAPAAVHSRVHPHPVTLCEDVANFR